jgi:hypothetical protein
MNLSLEQLNQEIGNAALAVAQDIKGKLVIYAEVENGVVSADIFYVNYEGIVRFLFCPKPTKMLIYSFWDQWKKHPGKCEWRVMCYVIDEGRFKVNLIYPDKLNKNERVSDRRPLAVKKYFGDMKVDYSRP